MKGTEKQIKWATDILNEAEEAFVLFAKNFEKMSQYGITELTDRHGRPFNASDVEKIKTHVFETLSKCDDAGRIINNRDFLTYEYFGLMAAEEHRKNK